MDLVFRISFIYNLNMFIWFVYQFLKYINKMNEMSFDRSRIKNFRYWGTMKGGSILSLQAFGWRGRKIVFLVLMSIRILSELVILDEMVSLYVSKRSSLYIHHDLQVYLIQLKFYQTHSNIYNRIQFQNHLKIYGLRFF